MAGGGGGSKYTANFLPKALTHSLQWSVITRENIIFINALHKAV